MNVELKKNFNFNVPSWEEILDNFNESVIKKEDIRGNDFGFFVSHDAHRIPLVKKVLNSLDLNEAHLYMNIAVLGGSFGKHKDEVDVYYWQVQGKTVWDVEGLGENILEPGDLIFIPRGVFHHVKPLTPRAGISMSRE